MKSLSIDFKNKTLCIMVNSHEITQYCDVPKDKFLAYIPKKYVNYTSYTWNFENDTIAMNQEYNMSKEAIESGSIVTKDYFIAECIVPMPGLGSLYSKFLKLLDLENTGIITQEQSLSELATRLRIFFRSMSVKTQ